MTNYPVKRLSEAGVTLYDCEHKTPKPAKSGYPYIAIPNIQDGRLNLSNVRLITKEDFDYWTRKIKPQKGDIIVTRRGRVGDTAVVPEGLECAIGQNLVILRSDGKTVDQNFLRWVLRGPLYEEQVRKFQNVGAIFYSLNCGDIPNFELPIPPIPDQHAIAGMLDALDDKIELNHHMNRTLESMARAVFRQWFVESEEVKEWGESSLEELFGRKSDCVLTGPFGSHLHAHDYREEGTPLILVKHVVDGHILEDRLPLVGEHKLPEMKRYLLKVGDIVFTRVGAVGRSAYIHPRHKGWLISGQTLRVRVPDKKQLNPRFLAQIYLEQSFIDMVEQHALGTTRPSLNTSILSTFKFVLPPVELQNRFGEFVDPIDKKVQQNLDESRTLASLRDTLLPKLMRGEVRVKDIERSV